MRLILLTLLTIPSVTLAQPKTGHEPSLCAYPYSCREEVVTGVDNRVKPHYSQPVVAEKIESSCDSYLPADEAYKARILPLTCGEGAVARDRLPIRAEKKVMDQWGKLERQGNRNEMQRIRQVEVQYSDEIEYPVYENWTYKQIVGEFDPRCGMQDWLTSCEKERAEEYTEYESYCAEYFPEPEPVQLPDINVPTIPQQQKPVPTFTGDLPAKPTQQPKQERIQEQHKDRYQKYKDQKKSSYHETKGAGVRFPAQRDCKTWAKRPVVKSRPATKLAYSCLKQRPNFCTWFEDRNRTRRCNNQTMVVNVNFEKDKNWNPSNSNYLDILPNKFDLLPGESEEIFTYANTGISSVMQPRVTFDNAWNKYSYSANPSVLSCEFKKKHVVNISVNTDGRIKRKAPNTLRQPVDKKGNLIEPLSFDPETDKRSGFIGKGKPYNIQLQDAASATILAAARQSRAFPRPEGSQAQGSDVVHKKKVIEQDQASVASNGYWADTRFRFQLYRQDKYKRWVKITSAMKFGNAQGDVFGDTMNISLTAKDGLPPFYVPTGPLEPILGSLWKMFGIELTPGEEYIIKVQVLQRGLPFYESGCGNGAQVCEGDEGKDEFYSEPVMINFTADPKVDSRSWFKRWKDRQEKALIF